MRIDLNPGSGVEGAQAAQSELRRSGAAGKTSSDDHRSTDFETSVGKLADVALSSPEVRQAKVEALRAQVDAGTYRVSDHSVAGSILEQLRVRS